MNHRLPRLGLALAAALSAVLLAPSASSGQSVQASLPEQCSFTKNGATVQFNATSLIQATLPDHVRPNTWFSPTDVRRTVTLGADAVKTLSAFGSGVQTRIENFPLQFRNAGPATTYNFANPSVLSTRAGFQVDQWNFDPAKTTYRPLSLSVTTPNATAAFFTGPTTGLRAFVVPGFDGQVLLDQWFGQDRFALRCVAFGTVLGSFQVEEYAPVIHNISPIVGPSTGGTTVTINGADLEGTTVRFGQNPAAILESSASRLVVRSPAGPPAQLVDIVVTGGALSSAITGATKFAYRDGGLQQPTITSLSPNTGLEFLGGTVTISGNDLAAATALTFNGQGVAFTRIGSQLTFSAPGLPKGTYPVVVTTPGGSATAQFTFKSWF
jgi:hypothetical protein